MESDLKIIIVGSGPAGMYAAGAFLKKRPDCRIDIIDKLATPYGLVRSGVAPDHQSTKNVTRAFDKVMRDEKTRFVGNILFGTDVSIADLSALYDVVVLATGTPKDRHMNIPGEHLKGVYGAQEFVYWYNAHPEYRHMNPNLNIDAACVIGHGNVALDVGRVILRSENEMRKSDLTDHARKSIFQNTLKAVHLIGRRGPTEARFTIKELSELGDMERAVPQADADVMPDDFVCDDVKMMKAVNAKLEVMRKYSALAPADNKASLYLDFYLKPVEILGDDHITGLKLEKTILEDGRAVGTGEFITFDCGLLVSCIGYEIDELDGISLKNGIIDNKDGLIRDNIYVVGWAKHGPSGTIGTNRIESQNVVDMILSRQSEGGDPVKTGASGLDDICRNKNIQTVSFTDWETINLAEIQRAPEDAPRRKFADQNEMLSLLNKGRG